MERFSQLQLRIIFIFASIILISLSVFSYLRINSLLKSSTLLNHTSLVKLELETTFSRVKDADSDQRGFVLTKDTTYVSNFKKTVADIQIRQKNLYNLTIDNYSQQRNLEVLNALIDKRIRFMEFIIQDSPQTKITTERWLEARKLMNDLRTQKDKMINEEQFLLKLRTKSLIKETALTPLFTFLLIIFLIVVLILSYYAISKELKTSNLLKSDLEKNIESLAKMNKELESFTYISSHDLQEPLRKIQTFVTRIIDKEYQNLSADSQNYLNKTNESAHRMQALIRDLLAYSRLKAEIFPTETILLQEIVDDVKQSLEEEILEKKVEIEVSGIKEITIIVSQFRQLLTNLISNSIKFSDPGRKLKIKINHTIVRSFDVPFENVPANKHFSKIMVTDNGIGFDPEYKARIFEVFQRLHTDVTYKGTGIGLAIVKKIVENHNGFITADGKLDEGATFIIYLPT